MIVRIHAHALKRMVERGGTKAEADHTVKQGKRSPAQYGRTRFSHTFAYNRKRLGKPYKRKTVEAFAVDEGVKGWLVITVIVKYFWYGFQLIRARHREARLLPSQDLRAAPGARIKWDPYDKATHMRMTYDPQYNIAYIQLRKKSGKVRTVAVSDELNVDLAEDGKIYGFELLNANEQLAKGKGMVLENMTTGQKEKLSLAG